MVLLPVSLPQLKDPINGIFREGLELAYDRSMRPNHADELRELVQDPENKTELVFFLDAYDGEFQNHRPCPSTPLSRTVLIIFPTS